MTYIVAEIPLMSYLVIEKESWMHYRNPVYLKLSPSKTVICPRSTTILGWIWTQGVLSASPHRVAVLAKCHPPDTVRGLRSFIGAYKVLSRVLPNCSAYTSPLERAIAGYQF